MKRIFYIILISAVITTGLYSAAAIESVDSGAVPEKARVGDTIAYTVTVKGAGLGGITVVLPEQKDYFPEADAAGSSSGVKNKSKKKSNEKEGDADTVPLYSVRSTEKELDDKGDSLEIKVLLVYMRTGTYTLPEIKITGSDGVAIGYKLPVVTIEQTNPEGAFEEIEPPVEPPADYGRMVMIAVLVLLLCCAAGIGAYFAYRYFKKRKEAVPPVPPVSPYEQFLTDLAGLEPEKFIESGRVKQYAFGMSMTFRRFISALFGFDAAEMTTDEIRFNLRRHMPAGLYLEHGGDIITAMDFWDISKFAGFVPSKELLADNLSFTKRLAEKISTRQENNGTPGV